MSYVNKLKKYTNKMKNVNDLDKFITYDYKLRHYQSMAGGGLNELLDSLTGKTTDLTKKYDEHKKNFAEIIAAISTLKTEKVTCTQQVTAMTESLRQENLKLEQAKSELKENETKISELTTKIFNINAKNTQLTTDLERAKAVCTASGTAVSEKKTQLDDLLKSHAETLLKITSENNDLKASLASQKTAYNKAVSDLQFASSDRAKTKLLYDALIVAKNTEEQNFTALTSELKISKTANTSLQSSVGELKDQIADLSEESKKLKEKEKNLIAYMQAVDDYTKSDSTNIDQLRTALGLGSFSGGVSAKEEEKKQILIKISDNLHTNNVKTINDIWKETETQNILKTTLRKNNILAILQQYTANVDTNQINQIIEKLNKFIIPEDTDSKKINTGNYKCNSNCRNIIEEVNKNIQNKNIHPQIVKTIDKINTHNHIVEPHK